MKVKFSELEKLRTWDYEEIMHSSEFLHFTEIHEKDECDIKLLIDDKEYEPKAFLFLYNSIASMLDNIEDHIEEKAIELMKEKLDKVEYKRFELDTIITDAVYAIKDLIPEDLS